LNSNNDKKIMDQLAGYTSNSYEFLTRSNAMISIRKLGYFDEVILNNCLEACLSSNARLAGPATETVKYFFAQGKYKKMISDAVALRPSKSWEREILNKLVQ